MASETHTLDSKTQMLIWVLLAVVVLGVVYLTIYSRALSEHLLTARGCTGGRQLPPARFASRRTHGRHALTPRGAQASLAARQ
jgi:hypothetical protein